jgi:hypothetical protein
MTGDFEDEDALGLEAICIKEEALHEVTGAIGTACEELAGDCDQCFFVAFIRLLTCSALTACDHLPRAAPPLNVTVLAGECRTLSELSRDASFREAAVDLKPKVVPAALVVELQWEAMLMVGYGLALLNQLSKDVRL